MISLIITKSDLGYFFESWDLENGHYYNESSTNFSDLSESEREIVILCEKNTISKIANHFGIFTKINEQFIISLEKDKKLKSDVEEYSSSIKKEIIDKFHGNIYLSKDGLHYGNKSGKPSRNTVLLKRSEIDKINVSMKSYGISTELEINKDLSQVMILNYKPLMYVENDNIIINKRGSNRLKIFNNKMKINIDEKFIKIYSEIISDFISNELIIPEEVLPLTYQINLTEYQVESVPKYTALKVDVYQNDSELSPLEGEHQLVFKDFRTFLRHPKENQLKLALQELQEDNVEYVLSWLQRNQQLFKEINLIVTQSNCNYFLNEVKVDFSLDDKIDWFDMNLKMTFGDYEMTLSEIKKILVKGKRTFELPDGSIALIPDEFSNYIISSNNGRVPKYVLLSDSEKYLNYKFEKKEHQFPQVKFKPFQYQIEGYNWLMDLEENSINGLLADDMGMGKTFQVIAMLVGRKEKLNGVNQLFDYNDRSLILAPSTVCQNWIKELERFSNISYQYLDASKNTSAFKIKIDPRKEIIITTYQYFQRRSAEFLEHDWDYLILDEAQYIKNPSSLIYEELLKMNPSRKLCLTGTPIENNLIDLWSIISFLNPGLLGSKSFYKQNYVNKIFDGDEDAIKRLKNILNIVLLKRNKKDYLKLPEKKEHLILCEMNEDQKNLYNDTKKMYQQKIYQGVNSFEVLRGLNVLRAISNHPMLFDENSNISSGKFAVIKEKIDELRSEGKKMLIFSQSVIYLEIMEKYFKSKKIKYLLLKGDTKDREEMIKKFEKQKIDCFLISIKAGGVGINLTAAENVLILDPSWNPSVENQAIDRAYRIGQDKEVNVYRFITKNTVEEKIRNLQEKKKKLSGLLNTEIRINNLSKAEMEQIFN